MMKRCRNSVSDPRRVSEIENLLKLKCSTSENCAGNLSDIFFYGATLTLSKLISNTIKVPKAVPCTLG